MAQSRAQGWTAQPCQVQHEQLLRKCPCCTCRKGRSSCLPTKQRHQGVGVVPGADPHSGICSFPSPALLHEGKEIPSRTVLQASQQSSSSPVCMAQSLVMKAMHTNKPMICSLAATCSCGCHCLWLLQLIFTVRDVGFCTLLVHQLPPGLKSLTPGTVGGFEAGFVVAGFALCEGEHG